MEESDAALVRYVQSFPCGLKPPLDCAEQERMMGLLELPAAALSAEVASWLCRKELSTLDIFLWWSRDGRLL